MSAAKEDIQRLLDQLPDDCTVEDVQYHLYVLEKIRRGQADLDAGRKYSHEEAKQRLSRWLNA